MIGTSNLEICLTMVHTIKCIVRDTAQSPSSTAAEPSLSVLPLLILLEDLMVVGKFSASPFTNAFKNSRIRPVTLINSKELVFY